MISTLIFLGSLIAAGLIAFKTRDKMFVTSTDRYGDQVNKFQVSWILKPVGIFILGIIVSSVQPFAIEKIDAGHKGLKINFCLLYTSPSPRDRQKSRMPSSA